MLKPLQTEEIFQYRKVSSFYAALLLLLMAILAIYLFNATYSDISILVILYVFILSAKGVIDESVIVSNDHFIIKRRILFFSKTVKKSWQDMTHMSQIKQAKQSSLKLRFSDDVIELSELDNDAKLYDFANLSSAIKSQASKYGIPIHIEQDDEKTSSVKQVMQTIAMVAFILLVWFLLSQLNLFMPHAMHQHTFVLWLAILGLFPYLYSYIYLKYINKETIYQGENAILKVATYMSYVFLFIFSMNYLATQYLVMPKVKVLVLTQENTFYQEWLDEKANLRFFIRDDASYIKNVPVGDQQKFLVSDGWFGDHAMVGFLEAGQKNN